MRCRLALRRLRSCAANLNYRYRARGDNGGEFRGPKGQSQPKAYGSVDSNCELRSAETAPTGKIAAIIGIDEALRLNDTPADKKREEVADHRPPPSTDAPSEPEPGSPSKRNAGGTLPQHLPIRTGHRFFPTPV